MSKSHRDDPSYHPAKFSDPIIEQAKKILDEQQPSGSIWRGLDPFAGQGGCFEVIQGATTVTDGTWRMMTGLEIESPWAEGHPGIIQGDATNMPFPDGYFDFIFTSPCYGNRFADKFKPKDTSRRHTYIGYLREITGNPDYKLQPNSACGMQWGDEYRIMHRDALAEMWRVLKPNGLLLLNMSDHVRGYERQQVCKWWVQAAHRQGFLLEKGYPIQTQRMREGENSDLRITHEMLFQLRKVA